MMPARLLILLACVVVSGCSAEAHGDAPTPAAAPAPKLADLETVDAAASAHPSFERYWYRGKAELSRYELSQSRYGATHAGEAVLIFVTEDFLRTKQVKYEGRGDKSDAVSVLKLNAYRRFYTGIYPYTLMTSVFAPAKDAASSPLKLTFSATEWCGQSFMQLNRRADHYDLEERSYFEAEGDRDSELPLTLVEDELFVRVRRDPTSLPTGPIELLPAAHHARLMHVPYASSKAKAALSDEKDGRRTYRIDFDSGRFVALTFETRFPHRIVAFEELPAKGQPITRATLTRSILLPYWEKNGPGDARYREALGLKW
jgi:hypothetical protein